MKAKGLVWLGTRTSHFKAKVNLYRDTLGLELTCQEPGIAILDRTNGDRVEVFGDESRYNQFFIHPVTGFPVEDVVSARTELDADGIELIRPTESAEDGNAWAHFRAPDGSIYELIFTPGHPLNQE
jgi:catechol 2,3-dioxygenase-like lactoylglutathione lyase family enzyme